MEYLIFIYVLLPNYILRSYVHASSMDGADLKPPPQYCQWDPPTVANNKICRERCFKRKGFIHSGQGRFLCSNEHEQAGSPKPIKYIKVDRLYDCECEHPNYRGIPCNPLIFQENITREECEEICKKYFVLIYVQNKRQEAYCEKASNIQLFNLEAVTLNVEKPKKNNTGELTWSKLCRCGINLDPEIEKKTVKRIAVKRERKYSKPLEELRHLCTIGEFPLSKKKLCKKKCASAKAFLDSSNELICYHDRREADAISSENEDCRCGTIVNKYKEDYEYKRPCPPQQPNEFIPANKCKEFCKKLSVYIFHGKEIQVSYCDSRKDAPEGFEGLEPQFKRFKKPSPSQRYYQLPCSCGLSSLLRPKKLNTIGNSSTFDAGNSQRNKQNSNTVDPVFDHVGIDNSTQNLYGASSSQPSTNPIMTRNSNGSSSTFPNARNQICNRDSIVRDSSSGGITNREITPNLNRNASGCFPPATGQISTQNSVRSVSSSQAVPSLVMAQNPNICARSSSGVVPIRGITPNRNRNAGDSLSVTNRLSGQNSDRDTSYAQSVPSLGIRQNPNLCTAQHSAAFTVEMDSSRQPVADFFIPPILHQPEMEIFEFSTSLNTNTKSNDDAMSPELISGGSASRCTRTQGENTHTSSAADVLPNQTTNIDEFTQPVQDLVVPSSCCMSDKGAEVKFLVPDLNIPYETSSD